MGRSAPLVVILALLLSLAPRASAQGEACAFTLIREIQGKGHLSPCAGKSVAGVVGVVTAVRRSGFYIQDPNPDLDPATSEGIFVYTTQSGQKPVVGDLVKVHGTVLEYRYPADALTVTEIETEITAPSFEVIGTGHSLPDPVNLFLRTVSSTNIDDDPEPNVETGGVFDPEPDRDAIDLYESLEGMRVGVPDPIASAGTSADGQLPVITGNAINAFYRLIGRGMLLRPGDPNPERIYLDDSIDGIDIPDVWAGTWFEGDAVGVMHYQYSNYRIVLTQSMPPIDDYGLGEPLDVVPPASSGRLTAAAYNVENLSAAGLPAAQARFDLLAAQIVNHLASPDLLVLEEIQDDDGSLGRTTSAALTLGALIPAIQSAGGPSYAWLQIDPEDNHDGGATNTNIRQVILYNPVRLQPAPAPPGAANDAVGLTPTGAPRLTLNPGRINPGAAAFIDSRKPLAAEFTFQGQQIFVIACHLNSKIGDDPLFGPWQPPRLSTEAKRSAQAAQINAFVRAVLNRSSAAYILVLGDMNEYAWAAPMNVLSTGGDATAELYNLAPSFDLGEWQHYTYIYEGNAQALDHIYASPAVNPGRALYADVHINAERAERDPLRASDHDPVWAALDLTTYPIYLPLVAKNP